jgi:hypothetical protein
MVVEALRTRLTSRSITTTTARASDRWHHAYSSALLRDGASREDADNAGSLAGKVSAKKSSVSLTLDAEPSAVPARGQPDRHLGAVSP